MITESFSTELKNKDLKDPLSKMGKKIVGVAKSTMKYELPFTPKNLERLYKMRPSEDAAFCIPVNRKGKIRW